MKSCKAKANEPTASLRPSELSAPIFSEFMDHRELTGENALTSGLGFPR